MEAKGKVRQLRIVAACGFSPGGESVQISGNGRKFIEEGWFKDFGEGLALKGSRCQGCGKISFPAKPVCPVCFDSGLQEVPLSKRGKLHTFTLSHMGPSGIQTPFVIGFIDLPEGIKLFSPLTQCEPWDTVLTVGMEMEMVIETVRRDEEGIDLIGYKFRPVTEANP